MTASPEFLYQKFLAEELGIPEVNILGVKSVVVDGKLTDDIILPIPQDDGKANVIPTFIKTRPLVVGGNSRGDWQSVVSFPDRTCSGKKSGNMHIPFREFLRASVLPKNAPDPRHKVSPHYFHLLPSGSGSPFSLSKTYPFFL